MQAFRTIVDVPVNENRFSYRDKLLMLGSCFSENIGRKLTDHRFQVNVNPFGIIYSAASIAASLNRLLCPTPFTTDDLDFANEQWFSYAHHGRFSHTDAEQCLGGINDALQTGAAQLAKAGLLILTFGSVYAYEHRTKQLTVANCHKTPAKEFNHYPMTAQAIEQLYHPLLKRIKELNPNIQIVFTVSPVRHWKYGAVKNQLSKSSLLLAINNLVGTHDYCSYFPAYEIMMDDLRDYRFYADDMLHPTALAVDYIWERFANSYVCPNCQTPMKQAQKIRAAQAHRVQNPGSAAHLKFLKKTLSQVQLLAQSTPGMVLHNDLAYFEHELAKYS